MQVFVRNLKEGMILSKPIYSGNSILTEKGTELTAIIIEKIKNFNIVEVEIEYEEDGAGEDIEKILEEERFLKESFKDDYRKSLKMIKALLESASKGKVKETEMGEVIDQILNNVILDSDIILSILENKNNKEYLFDHSVNTLVVSLVIGKALGYSEEQLHILGKGAILHDIGMLKVDETILAKAGDLSEEELAEVQRHPVYGAEMLEGQLAKEVIDIVKYHQERQDGSGYPEGLLGDEIPEMAKLVAISDIYTALIEDRNYRAKYHNFDAMKIVMQSSANLLDHKLLKIFLTNMPIYPINSRVLLNSEKIGIVVRANENPFRPVIDIKEGGKVKRFDLVRDINSRLYIVGLAK